MIIPTHSTVYSRIIPNVQATYYSQDYAGIIAASLQTAVHTLVFLLLYTSFNCTKSLLNYVCSFNIGWYE